MVGGITLMSLLYLAADQVIPPSPIPHLLPLGGTVRLGYRTGAFTAAHSGTVVEKRYGGTVRDTRYGGQVV